MKLATILREIQYVSRMNQTDIANILKCRQASVSRLINGKTYPTLKMAQRIMVLAKKYKIKVNLEDLLPTD
jgi:plasmid maintenance system antidote protein VapI